MTEPATTQPTPPTTQMIRMTENQCDYVALAQRVHGQLMLEATAKTNEANAKTNEATQILRQAVQGAFKEQNREIPTANVRIVNDERGRPTILTWDEVAKPEAPETAPAEETPSPAVNGKQPEAKKKLALK